MAVAGDGAAFASVIDVVRGLGWPARARVRRGAPGPHASRARGAAAELVEYRAYRQGDEPRLIDWKLVARTDRVFVRLSEEQAVLPTMIVLDASASMAFPAATHAKWAEARQLGLALAAVARHRGDPVGMIVAAARDLRVVAPRTRRTVLEAMMVAVGLSPAGSPPLAPALHEAMRLGRRVALVSDFLGDTESLLSAGRTFTASGGELFAVHVVDPGELDPGPRARLFADPEPSPGADELRRPMTPAAREEYLRRFGAWREQLARDWRRMGAQYAMVVPGAEPLRQSVRRIVTPSIVTPEAGR